MKFVRGWYLSFPSRSDAGKHVLLLLCIFSCGVCHVPCHRTVPSSHQGLFVAVQILKIFDVAEVLYARIGAIDAIHQVDTLRDAVLHRCIISSSFWRVQIFMTSSRNPYFLLLTFQIPSSPSNRLSTNDCQIANTVVFGPFPSFHDSIDSCSKTPNNRINRSIEKKGQLSRLTKFRKKHTANKE